MPHDEAVSLVETRLMQISHSVSGRFALVLGLMVFPVYEGFAKGDKILATQTGDATYYAKRFQGAQTASGLKFDYRKLFAAHRSYPFGTVARVTNLRNGKSVNVVVVDRGPYGKNRKEGAIIDLSRTAAEKLDMIRDGQVRVRVQVLKWGKPKK